MDTPQTPSQVTLPWSDDLDVALQALEKRLGFTGEVFEHSMDRVARRALEMIRRGEQPTADAIVIYMRDHDAPPVGTWAVDEPRFRARAEAIVQALTGDDPAQAILQLPRI